MPVSTLGHLFIAHFLLVWIQPCIAQLEFNDHSPYSRWEKGPPTDPAFFPIGVWLQSPRNAEKYKDVGINTYIALWKGPTEEQLAQLKKAGMKVVCDQNEAGLNSAHRDIIIAWMHGDEPDNAQPKAGGGYGPPIDPKVIQKDYEELRKRDPSRPVFLNLGQGVAYDQYIGRGVRRNHPEDYREYISGSDIVSFDIYPAVHDKPEVAGKLEYVPKGVQRLRDWSDDKKIVWNCIEASRISNTKTKPTPAQVRSEVWMSLIAGSRGLIYFVHQFEPQFREASLFEDKELLDEVTRTNKQIQTLAPVLNSPTLTDKVTVVADNKNLKWMCKEQQGKLYLFFANHAAESIEATVSFPQKTWQAAKYVDLLSEDSGTVSGGSLEVQLNQYGVAIYQVTPLIK